MKAAELLTAPDSVVLQITKQLRTAYELKKTIRYAGSRDLSIHGESVAEHVFALLFLAQYFLPLEDPKGTMDRSRIYEMLLYHDFGEILNGDMPYHYKNDADKIREHEDAKAIFGSLPSPLNSRGRALWEEYEERKTLEARFVHALDKIEPIFELFDPISEKSIKRTKLTYDLHLGKKLATTEGFPVMRKFVNVLSVDMKNRDLFWEKETD
ncbi:hypothetical protein A3G63_01735 [Candidatus Kaiserbacteria bacterium RIFCSPLOWO2_12_FULL_52_8]|uniref:5'-deoxynucleotidase n=1 Tax=Candidatus Kaiserbacteria bacterium RIFCSPHIGHO2_01_FULL_53_31 TaxID=1798481 RepID=A0A1F6CIZ7_9BACT|nr:MAG: hypothetical protein A2678_02770 [Candidatus Kaiserbacteria bacterium RIFCSPHIGHO2_01_FULL_53_31]OGG94415.1 MAG: hypothetical protein A3G63_01735 [Candidatus Kaiserbacteria bacterium RIFCSPLOWO2_12_FULL_52_8]